MLFLKLKAMLLNERAALGAMADFAGMGGLVQQRPQRDDHGQRSNRWQLLIPAGRRPDRVRKQLTVLAPHSDWTLVDIDAEGFEQPCLPDAESVAVRQ
jgi:hypothetical protein